jgi:hypothetical protein
VTTVCPANTPKQAGALCDDDNPETGTSACDATHACHGVTPTVIVQGQIPVPPTESPKRVTIPVTIRDDETAGATTAQVSLRGFVDCRQLQPPLPKRCRRIGIVGVRYEPRMESKFLPVTPRVATALHQAAGSNLTVGLPLTRLGRKLFAKLAPDETTRTLSVQIRSYISDRRGNTLAAVFPTILERQR